MVLCFSAKVQIVHPDPAVVGEIRITYELHSFRDQQWFRLNAWDQRTEAVAAAEQIFSEQTVDGVRVVRLEYYVDYDFIDTIITFKRLVNDVVEPDPLAPASEIGSSFYWRQVSDFFRDRSRDELRTQLGRYLEDRRITALELVYSEKHSIDLDNAGTILQGLIQRVALPVAQAGKLSAAGLYKDMMSVWSQLVLQLRSDSMNNKPPRLEAGNFLEVAAQLEKQFGSETSAYHMFRAIVVYLMDAKTWLEKLDRIGQLYEPECSRRHLRFLDTQAAEILSMAGPFRELLDEGADRVSVFGTVASLYGGSYKAPAGGLPVGVAVINTLMSDGRMPRVRATLRRRLLREMISRQPLVAGRALMAEIEALNQIIQTFKTCAPNLIQDEEMSEALVFRATRSISVQGVAESMNAVPKVIDKLTALSKLANLVPGAFNKALVFRHFRSALPPDELVRICLRESGNRMTAVTMLADIQKSVLALPIDETTRTDILGAIDAALLDIFKNDILLAANRSYADRLVLLLKVCSGIQLADGKARALAVETISREFRNPNFLPLIKGRFKSQGELRDMLMKVKLFLASDKPG